MTYYRDDVKVRLLKFEEISVGDAAELRHTLTQDDVNTFAELTGDFNPLHVDAAYAEKTLFRKPVVHGMLSASFISTMIGTLLPGSGALWTSQTLEFLMPAFVGDILLVRAVVMQKSVATRMLTLEVSITNQHGQTLVTGSSTVRALKIEQKTTTQMDQKTPRTILVTGGSRGIGAAIAVRLAELGHRVAVCYSRENVSINERQAEFVERGLALMAIRANVASIEDMQRLQTTIEERFGPVEDVVHCAAVTPVPASFEDTQWSSFQSQLDVQIGGAFNCAKLFLPEMCARKSGSLLFVGSIFAEGVPPIHQAPYVTAKAALTALARSLAVEYGPKGVRVNIIAPGMTETDMIASVPDKTKMLTKMNTPLRKLAEPADIAGVAEFLLGSAGRHITGETIRVCGGISM